MLHIRQKVYIFTLMTLLFVILSKTSAYADNITGTEIGTVTVKVLNMRQSPNTASKVLSKIMLGEQVKILESTKEWHKVNYKNIDGWVTGRFLKISKIEYKSGKVNVDILKVRKNPSTKAVVISKITKGKTFLVLDVSNNWYRIKTEDGIAGWICSDYVSLIKPAEPRKANESISRGKAEELTRSNIEEQLVSSIEEVPVTDKSLESSIGEQPQQANQEPGSMSSEQPHGNNEENVNVEKSQIQLTTGQQLVDYAKAYLGVKYKYGGNTPEEGFDCSGYTKYVFSNFSINLERTAASQALQGNEAVKDSLLIGDLVFFDTTGNGTINHVGIFIGEDKFIHASSPGRDVVITNLSDNYYTKSFVTARRILNDSVIDTSINN